MNSSTSTRGKISKELISNCEDLNGYGVGRLFSHEEASNLRRFIAVQYLSKLEVQGIDTGVDYFDYKIEHYHLLNIQNELHKRIWHRNNRKIPTSCVEYLTNTNFFKDLILKYGEVRFTDPEATGHPDINWRIVRPFEEEDVGAVHSDQWFYKANDWKIEDGQKLIKVWVMLSNGDIDRGLGIIPGSHEEKNWKYKISLKDGILKPEFSQNFTECETVDLLTPFGHGVVFNYDLLHFGLVNKFNVTRVSLDFSLKVPN